jgi:hypothetical protein
MWWCFGDYALDRLVGRDNGGAVSVVYDDSPPSITDVRKSLDLSTERPLHVLPELPSRVCNLDELVYSSVGELLAFIGGPIAPERDFRVHLLTQDLGAKDFVRLWSWKRRYPELQFGAALASRLDHELKYLRSLAKDFPDIELYLQLYEVVS